MFARPFTWTPACLRGRRVAVLAVTFAAAALGPVAVAAADPAPAVNAGAAGGARYAGSSVAGGAGVDVAVGPIDTRPVVSLMAVAPHRVTAGSMPVVRFRVRQRGVPTVAVQVRVYRAATRKHPRRLRLAVRLGRVPVGHTRTVRWPRSSALAAGRYVVSLHATDPAGRTLIRRPPRRGQASLTVVRPPAPQPAPAPAPAVPVVPTSAGIFPVAGPYTFGGEDAVFGAGRDGHIHQGQDITAAAGTPVVAPEAGTVIAVDRQRRGAGYYVTLHGSSGRDFFFAHFQKDSTAVTVGQAVAPGATLGRVGSTGAASGPHLHFEIWEGGWQRGQPVDPLAQLKVWAGVAR